MSLMPVGEDSSDIWHFENYHGKQNIVSVIKKKMENNI